MNVEHTKLNGVLAELRKKIKEHNDFLQEDDVEVVGKFKLEKERNKILTVKIREKENLLREIFNFLLKYEKKMTDIVLSLTISNLKFTSRSNRRFEEIGLTNKDKSMSFLNKLSCMPTWEQNECKSFLLKLF